MFDYLSNHAETFSVSSSIGVHLVDALLKLGNHIVVLDTFSTGHREKLAESMERGECDSIFHEATQGSVSHADSIRRFVLWYYRNL